MKKLIFLLFLIGAVIAVIALNMDVSVDTAIGKVNNLGLLADRWVYLFSSAFLIFVGLILFIFESLKHRGGKEVAVTGYKCPFCAEAVQKEAIKCKHCGSDLHNNAPTSEWVATKFYTEENGVAKLNNLAVEELIKNIHNENPGMQTLKLIDKYKNALDSVMADMPPKAAKAFAHKFYTLI